MRSSFLQKWEIIIAWWVTNMIMISLFPGTKTIWPKLNLNLIQFGVQRGPERLSIGVCDHHSVQIDKLAYISSRWKFRRIIKYVINSARNLVMSDFPRTKKPFPSKPVKLPNLSTMRSLMNESGTIWPSNLTLTLVFPDMKVSWRQSFSWWTWFVTLCARSLTNQIKNNKRKALSK